MRKVAKLLVAVVLLVLVFAEGAFALTLREVSVKQMITAQKKGNWILLGDGILLIPEVYRIPNSKNVVAEIRLSPGFSSRGFSFCLFSKKTATVDYENPDEMFSLGVFNPPLMEGIKVQLGKKQFKKYPYSFLVGVVFNATTFDFGKIIIKTRTDNTFKFYNYNYVQ